MGCSNSKQLQQDVKLEPDVLNTDILIIGAGFSGCYMADSIRKRNKHARIVQIERSNRVGGRLVSADDDQNPKGIQDELGGMRFFPSKMPHIHELAKRFNLTIKALPLNDGDSIFQAYDRISSKNEAAFPAGSGKYEGQHPTIINTVATEEYKKTVDWQVAKPDAYKSSLLRHMSLPEFFRQYAGASDKEIRYWYDYSGYNVYHNDIQASLHVADGELLGSDLTKHHFVQQGYMRLVLGLRNDSGIEPKLTRNVERISKDENGRVTAYLEDGKMIKCKKMVIAVNANDIRMIKGLDKVISEDRYNAIMHTKPNALFKVFLDFPKPWWRQYNYTGGKSTTETHPRTCCGPVLSNRQVHYYDCEDMLIYSSDGDNTLTVGNTYATNWERVLKKKGAMYVYKKMFNSVKKMHIKMGVPADAICEVITPFFVEICSIFCILIDNQLVC